MSHTVALKLHSQLILWDPFMPDTYNNVNMIIRQNLPFSMVYRVELTQAHQNYSVIHSVQWIVIYVYVFSCLSAKWAQTSCTACMGCQGTYFGLTSSTFPPKREEN